MEKWECPAMQVEHLRAGRFFFEGYDYPNASGEVAISIRQ